MYCPSCGKAIPTDSDFCPECGQSISVRRQRSRPSPIVWICLAALAAAVLLGTIGFEVDGYECGSPFSAEPFIADDPCISAIWTRRVIIILVVVAAGTGLVYGLTKKTKRANSEP
jgi:predicted nucleic acid-binding Zn ribbon protein